MKILTYISLCLFFTLSINSQTSLSAGDIAIIQYNARDGALPEEIKFLALKSMETGTIINFTDNGWKNNDTFRDSEGIDIWTAPSNIKCGEIITYTLDNVKLGTNGDQILAYQGTAASPTFIYALNNFQSATWQSNASNSKSSALPMGLTNGVNAIALTEADSAMFDSTILTGTKAVILDALCNNAYWDGSNSVIASFSDTFTSETTWTTSWSNPNPEDYFKAIIDGDYDTDTYGNFTTCHLQINPSTTFTVNAGGTITVDNAITNNGTIIVENNGSLIQGTKDGPNTGTNYTVYRESTSQLEEGNYTYWATPLTSATLADVTNAQRYYSFNASTQAWSWETSSSSMSPGVGYINTGKSGIAYPNTYTAAFSGAAFNNGDIAVSLGFSSDGDDDNDWNLLGNPYPSAIDADQFIADNLDIGGTLYFWTHNTRDSAGDNTQDDYVLWNGSGGTGPCTGCVAPDGNISSGQGFFAQALAANSATFTNSMRIVGNNTLFYKGGKKQKNRVWLNLIAEKSFSQTLIGFFNQATDGVDRIYDGLRLNSGASISFYSILEGKNYGIQGKAALKESEKIPLGFNSNITGDFKIEIEKIEGDLKKSKVFIFDKVLNIKHNIKEGAYTFNVESTGVFNNRFELLINPKKNDDDDESGKDNVKIYLKKQIVHVKSKNTIKRVKILDIYGQKVFDKKVNTKTVNINLKKSKINNLYIIKVILKNGKSFTKKVLD